MVDRLKDVFKLPSSIEAQKQVIALWERDDNKLRDFLNTHQGLKGARFEMGCSNVTWDNDKMKTVFSITVEGKTAFTMALSIYQSDPKTLLCDSKYGIIEAPGQNIKAMPARIQGEISKVQKEHNLDDLPHLVAARTNVQEKSTGYSSPEAR